MITIETIKELLELVQNIHLEKMNENEQDLYILEITFHNGNVIELNNKSLSQLINQALDIVYNDR